MTAPTPRERRLAEAAKAVVQEAEHDARTLGKPLEQCVVLVGLSAMLRLRAALASEDAPEVPGATDGLREVLDMALVLAVEVRHAYERDDRAAMRLFGTNVPQRFAHDLERKLPLADPVADAPATTPPPSAPPAEPRWPDEVLCEHHGIACCPAPECHAWWPAGVPRAYQSLVKPDPPTPSPASPSACLCTGTLVTSSACPLHAPKGEAPPAPSGKDIENAAYAWAQSKGSSVTARQHILALLAALSSLRSERDAFEAEMRRQRPIADAYRRVCEALGIEHDILGHVANLQAALEAERQRAEKDLQEKEAALAAAIRHGAATESEASSLRLTIETASEILSPGAECNMAGEDLVTSLIDRARNVVTALDAETAGHRESRREASSLRQERDTDHLFALAAAKFITDTSFTAPWDKGKWEMLYSRLFDAYGDWSKATRK